MLSTHPQTEYKVSPVTSVKLKICGITLPAHARIAACCRADMVGVVFASSRRQVSIETALAIREALGNGPMRPLLVGVFVNETPEQMLGIARKARLDVAQLSGDESPDSVAECAKQIDVIKAFRFSTGTIYNESLALLDSYATYNLGNRLRFLIDAYHPGEYGGTGQIADWSLAARIAEKYPVILAGGLNAANVLAATKQVSAWGIDVSSGVERDGAKDPQLIKEFALAARS